MVATLAVVARSPEVGGGGGGHGGVVHGGGRWWRLRRRRISAVQGCTSAVGGGSISAAWAVLTGGAACRLADGRPCYSGHALRCATGDPRLRVALPVPACTPAFHRHASFTTIIPPFRRLRALLRQLTTMAAQELTPYGWQWVNVW